MQREQQILDQVRSGHHDVIFLGDSMVDFWDDIAGSSWSQQIEPFGAANFGVASDSTQHLLWRLNQGELAGRPKVVVVEIGTNNLIDENANPTTRVEDTVAGIFAVLSTIRTLSPETRILLMGLFPQGTQPDDPMRLEISQINQHLASIAADQGIPFLDISSVFLQPDGTRPGTIYGVHPTPQDYDAWAKAIDGPLRQLLGRPASPAVQGLQVIPFKRSMRTIVLTYSDEMEANSVQNLANYVLRRELPRNVGRTHIELIQGVVYDTTARTATLLLARPLKRTVRYELTVNGTPPSGVRNLFGIALDGAGNGQPGQPYVAVFKPGIRGVTSGNLGRDL